MFWAEAILRPHGSEPSGPKPIPRTSRMWTQWSKTPTADLTDPCFREPCGQPKMGNRVDYGWVKCPFLVQFFTRFLVPSTGYYQNWGCPAIHRQTVRLFRIIEFIFLDQKGRNRVSSNIWEDICSFTGSSYNFNLILLDPIFKILTCNQDVMNSLLGTLSAKQSTRYVSCEVYSLWAGVLYESRRNTYDIDSNWQ